MIVDLGWLRSNVTSVFKGWGVCSFLDVFNVYLSALTLLATLFIPIVIVRYKLRQEKLARRERLKSIEKALSKNADSFFILQKFKESCELHEKHYAIVYHDRPSSIGGETMDYVKLDTARVALANMWDGIKDDHMDGLLPRTGLNARVIQRGKNYMSLAEPLDCANWYRNNRQGDYVRNGRFSNQRPGRYQWLEIQYYTLEKENWMIELSAHYDKLLNIATSLVRD